MRFSKDKTIADIIQDYVESKDDEQKQALFKHGQFLLLEKPNLIEVKISDVIESMVTKVPYWENDKKTEEISNHIAKIEIAAKLLIDTFAQSDDIADKLPEAVGSYIIRFLENSAAMPLIKELLSHSELYPQTFALIAKCLSPATLKFVKGNLLGLINFDAQESVLKEIREQLYSGVSAEIKVAIMEKLKSHLTEKQTELESAQAQVIAAQDKLEKAKATVAEKEKVNASLKSQNTNNGSKNSLLPQYERNRALAIAFGTILGIAIVGAVIGIATAVAFVSIGLEIILPVFVVVVILLATLLGGTIYNSIRAKKLSNEMNELDGKNVQLIKDAGGIKSSLVEVSNANTEFRAACEIVNGFDKEVVQQLAVVTKLESEIQQLQTQQKQLDEIADSIKPVPADQVLNPDPQAEKEPAKVLTLQEIVAQAQAKHFPGGMDKYKEQVFAADPTGLVKGSDLKEIGTKGPEVH